jgi:hypothetical protein
LWANAASFDGLTGERKTRPEDEDRGESSLVPVGVFSIPTWAVGDGTFITNCTSGNTRVVYNSEKSESDE